MEKSFQKLIEEYLAFARDSCRIISKQAQTQNILEAANTGSFPREGRFIGYGGGTYYIHGSGCEVHAEELEIDFDFGPDSTIPGFDPWKLYNFAKGHADAYQWLPDRSDFNKTIEGYVKAGMLKRINSYPSPNLLCL